MALISREQLLNPVRRPEQLVDVPELGEDAQVKVVGFTAKERTEFESQFQDSKGNRIKSRGKEFRQRLLLASVRDDAGNPLLKPEDIEAIGEQSAAVIERIVDVAMKLCGLSGSDAEEAQKK